MRRTTVMTGVLVAATLALAACTPPAAPSAWQQSVQTLASQASAGDYASALAGLDALEAEVIARRDAGEITTDEADGILSRIATVRADLSSLAPTPTPTPSEQQTTEPAQDDSQDSVSDDGDDQQSDPPAEQQPSNEGPGGKGGDKGDKGPGGKDSGPGKKDG
ncbi:hypothetical protein [Microbacterium testaceum]|uniref:Uncharacterized protein n=1 Tax=Microbacterium testaceum TaxID=2033 RepID=A0A2T7W6J4_MICTE|nr:hypothetical protein [Microbacterium testaceum]PVE65193.1 hypothetical protein DC432_13240 [Microbacterium testaceum]